MSDPTIVSEVAWTTRDTLYAVGIGISLLFSIISTVISIISLISSRRRDLNSFGDSERNTFDSIAKAEEDFATFNLEMLKEKEVFEAGGGSNFKMSDLNEKTFTMKACSVLNAYEIACQRYRDGKLDKVRFGKTYKARLSKVCSDPTYSPIINNGGHSYSALKKVNDELNDYEK